jgi:drug/metabolite transporter (DMT)-like permease
MLLGLFAALGASVCYGVATVLQAVAARSAPHTADVDPRLLLRLLRRIPFLGGVVLDVVGFALQFLALRQVPVFLVQTALAANLAVTALVAVPVLGARLTRRDGAAVVMVCLGLAVLAVSAGPEGDRTLTGAARLGLLASVLLLAGAGFAAGRLPDPARSAVLGAVAGLGFGVVALAARALTAFSPARLIADTAAYALVGGGLVAFLFFATGLQRGAVTVTTAAVVVGETIVPATVGVVALGDRIRPGFVPVAAIGFVVALAGALLLTRFGEAARQPAGGDRAA